MKNQKSKSHKQSKTEIALMQEIDTLKLRLKEQEELDKLNKELVTRMKAIEDSMKKEPEEQKPEIKTVNPDELFLDIRYDKEGKGEATTKNYWGKLVHAEINRATGTRYFTLIGEDGIYRKFNKERTVNKEVVEQAVEKLFAIRRAAAKDDLYAAH